MQRTRDHLYKCPHCGAEVVVSPDYDEPEEPEDEKPKNWWETHGDIDPEYEGEDDDFEELTFTEILDNMNETEQLNQDIDDEFGDED